jgi:hypothetical protein
VYPLLTRDPSSGAELIVTRLECPQSGVVIEGRFTLGWIGALTPEQLDFVGLLLRSRNNLQKVANDLGVAYNTARSRLDDIVEAVEAGGARPVSMPGPAGEERIDVLDRLASGEITYDEALRRLRG